MIGTMIKIMVIVMMVIVIKVIMVMYVSDDCAGNGECGYAGGDDDANAQWLLKC